MLPLTLGNSSTSVSRVRTGSAFHQNANVTSLGELHVFEPGTTFNLNAGTLAVRGWSSPTPRRSTAPAGTTSSPRSSWTRGTPVPPGERRHDQYPRSVYGASFTLQKNLTLSGALTVNNSTLNLGGQQASVGSLVLSATRGPRSSTGVGGGIARAELHDHRRHAAWCVTTTATGSARWATSWAGASSPTT